MNNQYESKLLMIDSILMWIRKNWRWFLFNLFGAGVLVVAIIYPILSAPDYLRLQTFEAVFRAAGAWGIRFLLISLAITPIYILTGWRSIIPLRKPAGLWAFLFVCIHIGTLFVWNGKARGAPQWFISQQLHVVLGAIAATILLAMALTSNRWSMRMLGKKWKMLHKLVYIVGLLALLHATARMKFVGPEFEVYTWVLLILLALRLPFVKDAVRHSRYKVKHIMNAEKPKRKRTSSAADL